MVLRGLGGLWGSLGGSWRALGSMLGRFGGSEGLLGDLLEVLGGSWVVLRASESVLKPSWAVMGRLGSFGNQEFALHRGIWGHKRGQDEAKIGPKTDQNR